jgi:hypothetical protein
MISSGRRDYPACFRGISIKILITFEGLMNGGAQSRFPVISEGNGML